MPQFIAVELNQMSAIPNRVEGPLKKVIPRVTLSPKQTIFTVSPLFSAKSCPLIGAPFKHITDWSQDSRQ